MDDSETTSPLMVLLSAGLAIGIPLVLIHFKNRPAPAAAPAGAALDPAPSKPTYRSAKELRDELDNKGLLEEAGRRKDTANGFLQKGIMEPALQGYLAAIWLLKVSRPTYPEVLSGQVPPADEEAVSLLGSGRGAAPAPPRIAPGRIAAVRRAASLSVAGVRARLFPPPPPAALESEASNALRLALHLNVAACALKRDDWYLAREACAFVLAQQPAQPKALYRLAQARSRIIDRNSDTDRDPTPGPDPGPGTDPSPGPDPGPGRGTDSGPDPDTDLHPDPGLTRHTRAETRPPPPCEC